MDFWAHRFADDPDLAKEEFETPDFDKELAAFEAEMAAAEQSDAWDTIASDTYGDAT